MSAAIGMKDARWTPTIVERAPERRTGGYFIGMFAEGIEAARSLGVHDAIHRRTPDSKRSWEIVGEGRERGVGFLEQPGSPQAVLRGDIEAGLWSRIKDEVEVRFDTVPTAISTVANRAEVTLRRGTSGTETTETFDLVVGADGLRSTVRRLVFGPDRKYMKSLDAMICAFQMRAQLPELDPEESAVIAEPRRSLWVFALKDTAPTALFTYRTKDIDAQFTKPVPQVLGQVYAGMSGGSAIAHAIEEVDHAPQFLFDSVHQVKMRSWRRGRVVLVGDAAWCLSLYSGMGATAGLLGGARLGAAFTDHPADGVEEVLAGWEAGLRPFVAKHQKSALFKAQVFVPSSSLLARLRRRVLRSTAQKSAQKALEAGTVEAVGAAL